MTILVITKQPAAVLLVQPCCNSVSVRKGTSDTGDGTTSQHHPPCLGSSTERTADEEDEYCRLHHYMSTKDICHLTIDWEKCGVCQYICVCDPGLIAQLIERRGDVYCKHKRWD